MRSLVAYWPIHLGGPVTETARHARELLMQARNIRTDSQAAAWEEQVRQWAFTATPSLTAEQAARVCLGPALAHALANPGQPVPTPYPPSTPASPDLFDQATTLAGELCSRFGCIRVTSILGLPLPTLLLEMDRARTGLATLSRSLGVPETGIGAGRLGLGWGGGNIGQACGGYDPVSRTVFLSDQAPFVHEWVHALDWRDGRAHSRVAVEQPGSAWHKWWNTPDRSHPGRWRTEAVVWASEVVCDLPEASWRRECTRWLASAPADSVPSDVWDYWRLDAPALPINALTDRWHRCLAVLHEMARLTHRNTDPASTVSRLRRWSQAKDIVDEGVYWDDPAESLARGIQVLLGRSVGHDHWLVGDTQRRDQYPSPIEADSLTMCWRDLAHQWGLSCQVPKTSTSPAPRRRLFR